MSLSGSSLIWLRNSFLKLASREFLLHSLLDSRKWLWLLEETSFRTVTVLFSLLLSQVEVEASLILFTKPIVFDFFLEWASFP